MFSLTQDIHVQVVFERDVIVELSVADTTFHRDGAYAGSAPAPVGTEIRIFRNGVLHDTLSHASGHFSYWASVAIFRPSTDGQYEAEVVLPPGQVLWDGYDIHRLCYTGLETRMRVSLAGIDFVHWSMADADVFSPGAGVRFFWNDGSRQEDPIFHRHGIVHGRALNPGWLARLDYHFVGWRQGSPNGPAVQWQRDVLGREFLEIDRPINFYARWEPIHLWGMYADVFEGEAIEGFIREGAPTNDTPNWFAHTVRRITNRGIMSGMDVDGWLHFGPNDELTRAQLMTILRNMEGLPRVNLNSVFRLPNGQNRFADIVQTHSGHWIHTSGDRNATSHAWFINAAAWSVDAGIVRGIEINGRLHLMPNQAVTRAELATMLINYLNFKNIPHTRPTNAQIDSILGRFADTPPTWARRALATAVANGLMSGIDVNGRLQINGNHTSTRAQAATMVMNMIDRLITRCDRGWRDQWFERWIW